MRNKLTVIGFFCASFALLLGLFPPTADAMSVFRGQNIQDLIELLRIKRADRKGIQVERARTTEGPLEEVNFSEEVEQRSQRRTTGRRTNYYTTPKMLAPQQKFKNFSVKNEFGFRVSLPEGFVKKGDTLTATDGMVEFETTNSFVKISALGNICEGGLVAVKDCLNRVSDDFTDDLQVQYPSGIILQKEIIDLRASYNSRFDQKNTGKQFIFDIGDQRIAVLTFIDPLMQYLWRMEITAPDNDSGVLNQGGVLNQIRESLFLSMEEEEKEINIPRRVTTIRNNNRLRSSFWGLRTNALGTVSSRDDVSYSAKEIPFEISVPKNFYVASDELMRDGGMLILKNGEGKITITPMKSVCSSQTQSIVRKCVERSATDMINDLREANPEKTSLGIKNYQLRLTSSTTELSVARGEVLMSGSDRVAVFVFAEPVYGYLWKVEVDSNKGQTGVLGDARKMKNLLGSMRFIE